MAKRSMSDDLWRMPREAIQAYLMLHGFAPMQLYRSNGRPDNASFSLRLVNMAAPQNIYRAGAGICVVDAWEPAAADWRHVEWATFSIQQLRASVRALLSESGITQFVPEDYDEY